MPEPLRLTKTERRREWRVVKTKGGREGGDKVINSIGLNGPNLIIHFHIFFFSFRKKLLSNDLFVSGISFRIDLVREGSVGLNLTL